MGMGMGGMGHGATLMTIRPTVEAIIAGWTAVGRLNLPGAEVYRDAAVAALQQDRLGYTVALGLPELRARIARLYRDWYGLDLDPAVVAAGVGAGLGLVVGVADVLPAGRALRCSVVIIRSDCSHMAETPTHSFG